MSFSQYSKSLYRPCSSVIRLTCTSHREPLAFQLLTNLQTRGAHNRASQRHPRPTPNQDQRAQPSHLQDVNGNEHEILYAPNNEQYKYTHEEPEFANVRVRFLRPAIWALSVSTGIFVSLAYLEARREMKPKVRNWRQQWQPQRATPPTPTEVVTRAWTQLDPVSQLSWGIIGANGVVHLSSFLVPKYWQSLWHTPARNVNYSLFTSAFVHSGAFHFGFNMWACYNFLPPVAYSALFRGDTYHMLSFFLSGGLLSGFAQHMASAIFKQGRAVAPAFIPAGGASGALFAVFGAFCMQYPQQGVGIMFVPYYVDAQYFMPAVMLFDLVGMIRGYSFVSFGHGAHLAGASLGAAYSYFDGHNNVWRPLVTFWKRRLQNS